MFSTGNTSVLAVLLLTVACHKFLEEADISSVRLLDSLYI